MQGSLPSLSLSRELHFLALLEHAPGGLFKYSAYLFNDLLDCRCPTECRLVNTDTSWTCIVKLYFMTNEGRPRIIPFGDVITAKADVEERIRRAQRAILNPKTNPDSFLNDVNAAPGENELSFSRSYVSLEISGRELADLSFVDLPGLIASVGHAGSANDIDLVKSLVVSYIEKPSCLILLTVACESMSFICQCFKRLINSYQPTSRIRARITW